MQMLGREVHLPQDIWLHLAEQIYSAKDHLLYVHGLGKTLGKHGLAVSTGNSAQTENDLCDLEYSYNKETWSM